MPKKQGNDLCNSYSRHFEWSNMSRFLKFPGQVEILRSTVIKSINYKVEHSVHLEWY